MLDGLADDGGHAVRGEFVAEVLGVQERAKVLVQALVAADQFVGERETGHQAALLEPENRAKGSRKQEALDAHEGHEALGERPRFVHPLERPLRLLLDAGNRAHGLEQVLLLHVVVDVGVDEQAVGLVVNGLVEDLVTVEEARLGNLDLVQEILREILLHDAVGTGEKCQDVLDKVLFVGLEFVVPVVAVLAEINLLGRPETRDGALVHVVHVGVLDGKGREAQGVFEQEGLLQTVAEVVISADVGLVDVNLRKGQGRFFDDAELLLENGDVGKNDLAKRNVVLGQKGLGLFAVRALRFGVDRSNRHGILWSTK